MIVSASYKTDIPAFYSAWFRNRLRAGFCRVRNPYGGKPFEVSLKPEDVDGYVFWTRNLSPFFNVLEEIDADGVSFVVQLTVTGYGRELETATLSAEQAMAQIEQVADRWGRRRPVWRYDPIVFSDLTPPDWHVANFKKLAEQLSGSVDEVVVSFLQPYRKTTRNLNAAAEAHGFIWEDPDSGRKKDLLEKLAEIGGTHGIRTTLCGQPDLIVEGVAEAACIDADRLSDIAGRPIGAAAKPHRQTCRCAASRDIGGYDTCPHGCTYCYAVSNRDRAKEYMAEHEPTAAAL